MGLFFWTIPLVVKQGYLVVIGVTVAYVFTWIPEWSTWVMLVFMSLYDICAVLIPGGPLKVTLCSPFGLSFESGIGGISNGERRRHSSIGLRSSPNSQSLHKADGGGVSREAVVDGRIVIREDRDALISFLNSQVPPSQLWSQWPLPMNKSPLKCPSNCFQVGRTDLVEESGEEEETEETALMTPQHG